MSIIAAIVMTVSLFFLLEIFLTLGGLHKGPVLMTFEQYGGHDPIYHPWPRMFFWLSILSFSGGALLVSFFQSYAPGNLMGVVMLILAFFAQQYRPYLENNQRGIILIPTWYKKLYENTSRYERRRIAYMWLHLPIRTRLIYNASDRFFFQWADLIIMSTTRES